MPTIKVTLYRPGVDPAPIYTPENWYWFVGEDEAHVFASAKASYVEVNDTAYMKWREQAYPTRIASETELRDVLNKAFPAGAPANGAAGH